MIKCCKYCSQDSESLMESEALIAYIEDGLLGFEGRGYDGEFQRGDLWINFCPMCGRKLGDRHTE